MGLLRIKRPESLKEHDPASLGAIVGFDRAPEVKTVRRKLERLAVIGKAAQFSHALANGIEVRGGYAFIANGPFGLTVLDVTDPSKPRGIGQEFLVGVAWDVALSGSYAYVASGIFGIQVIDISDPTKPKWANTIWNGQVVRKVRAYDGFAVTTGVARQVASFNIGNESAPATAGSYKAGRAVDDFVFIDQTLYLRRDDGKVDVVEVDAAGQMKSVGILGNDDVVMIRTHGKYGVKRDQKKLNVYEFHRL
jgi:hypothetical protein